MARRRARESIEEVVNNRKISKGGTENKQKKPKKGKLTTRNPGK